MHECVIYISVIERLCVLLHMSNCVCVCVSARMGVNRKTKLEGSLLLEKSSFESTFVLTAAGCNTHNTTRHKRVTGKVKLTSEATNTSEMHLNRSINT